MERAVELRAGLAEPVEVGELPIELIAVVLERRDLRVFLERKERVGPRHRVPRVLGGGALIGLIRPNLLPVRAHVDIRWEEFEHDRAVLRWTLAADVVRAHEVTHAHKVLGEVVVEVLVEYRVVRCEGRVVHVREHAIDRARELRVDRIDEGMRVGVEEGVLDGSHLVAFGELARRPEGERLAKRFHQVMHARMRVEGHTQI